MLNFYPAPVHFCVGAQKAFARCAVAERMLSANKAAPNSAQLQVVAHASVQDALFQQSMTCSKTNIFSANLTENVDTV